MSAGRPSKLTDELTEKLCEAIRLGSTYELSCNSVGISYSVFRTWFIKGESAKSGKYLKLFEAVKKAEGDAVKKWLDLIEKAAEDGNWPAAAWKLERRYFETFGKRTKQQIQQQNIDFDTNDLSKLTTEQLKRVGAGEDIVSVLADK